jgi:hypothetical protein
MTRIAVLGTTLCLAGGLAACDTISEPPTNAPDMRAAASVGQTDAPQPLKGELRGSDEYGALCGGGQGIIITSTATGTVSHFGQTLMVSTSCVNWSNLTVIGDFPFSLTAANGDQAGGLITSFVFTDYGFDLHATISWGTGRFENATGELVFPTRSDNTGDWTSGVDGWIRY